MSPTSKTKHNENPLYFNLNGGIPNDSTAENLETSSPYTEIHEKPQKHAETNEEATPELRHLFYANNSFPHPPPPLSSSNGATGVNNFPVPPDKQSRLDSLPTSGPVPPLPGADSIPGLTEPPLIRETPVDCPSSPLLEAARDFEQLRNIEVSCDALLGKVVRHKNSRA